MPAGWSITQIWVKPSGITQIWVNPQIWAITQNWGNHVQITQNWVLHLFLRVVIYLVTVKVKSIGHIWGLEFNSYVCFSFRGNRTPFGWDIRNSIFDLEKKSRSWSKSNPMVTFEVLEFNRYVCFSFRGNRAIFGWDIANSILDLEKYRSMSWPRSNLMVTFKP